MKIIRSVVLVVEWYFFQMVEHSGKVLFCGLMRNNSMLKVTLSVPEFTVISEFVVSIAHCTLQSLM